MSSWLLDNVADATFVVDWPSTDICAASDSVGRKLGLDVQTITGQAFSDLLTTAGKDTLGDLINRLAEGGEHRLELLFDDGVGESVATLTTIRIVDASTAVITVQLLADLRRSQSQLSDLMHLARLTHDIFVVCDEAGVITYVNEATRRFHGEQQFVGRTVDTFAEPESWNAFMTRVLNGETRLETRILGVAEDGSLTPLLMKTEFDPDTGRWYTVERDISDLVAREEQEKALLADLKEQASTDSLTGLANRAAFRSQVEEAIHECLTFSILLLDMDDFKSVNDTLGHSAGDDFLIGVAKRLRGSASDRDLVARLGGDEFVVFAPELDGDQVSAMAGRILEAISRPLPVAGTEIQRSCSIGGAAWHPGESFSQIMQRADRAAYMAKHAGRSRFAIL